MTSEGPRGGLNKKFSRLAIARHIFRPPHKLFCNSTGGGVDPIGVDRLCQHCVIDDLLCNCLTPKLTASRNCDSLTMAGFLVYCSKHWAKQFYRDLSTDEPVVHIAVEEQDRKKARQYLKRQFPDQRYEFVDPWQSSCDPSIELSPGQKVRGRKDGTVQYFLFSGSIKRGVHGKELGITVSHGVDKGEDVVDEKTGTTVGKCREDHWCVEHEGDRMTADLALLEMNTECSVCNTVQLPCGVGGEVKTFRVRIHRGEIPAKQTVIILDRNGDYRYGRIYKDELTDPRTQWNGAKKGIFGLYSVLEIASESGAAVTAEGDSGALVMSVPTSESDFVFAYGTVIALYNIDDKQKKTIANSLPKVIGAISKKESSQLRGNADDIDFA